MNAKVDVLGELRRVIADEREWGDREDAERVGAVYEVVAELIDVATVVLAKALLTAGRVSPADLRDLKDALDCIGADA